MTTAKGKGIRRTNLKRLRERVKEAKASQNAVATGTAIVLRVLADPPARRALGSVLETLGRALTASAPLPSPEDPEETEEAGQVGLGPESVPRH